MSRKRSVVGVACGGVVLLLSFLSIASQVANSGLRQELQHRAAVERAGLMQTVSNRWTVVDLNGQADDIRNPRDISGAWFSGNADVVAWNILRGPGEHFAACPSPIIVETSSGVLNWQVPGNVINSAAIAVSDDGQRVAFDGTYKPHGTGFLNTTDNRQHWITGLQIADMRTKSVSLIRPLKASFDGLTVPENVGWISWSPDANGLVYDFDSQIYLYSVISKTSIPLVRGSNPTWSPDGKWIGFRSPSLEASVIDPTTRETHVLIPGKKIIWGIHWSPDSQYVAFGQTRSLFIPFVTASQDLVVYRLRDGASVPIYSFGYTDFGSDAHFYWVKDTDTFLKAARTFPTLQSCDKP